ncbi:MAG: DUF2695 domain-containing protein [Pyrinomonadaceae bacterium]
MAIVKKREIEIMEQLNGDELERYLGKLPASKQQFDELFAFLEAKIAQNGCDHTSRYTMQFMMQRMMNFAKVSGWLSQNGGYCDCKILEEIAVPWRKMFAE